MASPVLIPFVPSDNAVARGVAACTPASLRSVQHNVAVLQGILTRASSGGAFGSPDVVAFLESFLKHRQRPYDALEDAIDARQDELQKLDALCLRALEHVVSSRHTDVTASLLVDAAAVWGGGNPHRLRALFSTALLSSELHADVLAAVEHAAPMLAVDIVSAARAVSLPSRSPAGLIDCIRFTCDVVHTLSALTSCAPSIAATLLSPPFESGLLVRSGSLLPHVMIAYERTIPQLACALAECEDDVIMAQRTHVWRLLQVASVSATLLLHHSVCAIAPSDAASTTHALQVVNALAGVEIARVFESDAAVRTAPALLRDTCAAQRTHEVLLAHATGPDCDALRQALTVLVPASAAAVSAAALPAANPTMDHASSVASVKSVLPDVDDDAVERAVALSGGDAAAAIDRLLTAAPLAPTAAPSRADVKDATLRLVEMQAMEEAAARDGARGFRLDEESGMMAHVVEELEYGDEYQDEYDERVRDAREEGAEDARAASGAPSMESGDAAPFVHRGGRGRGRGRGASAAGDAAAKHVDGHGPRARGGLTARDATFRREHKAHIGNHNRRRGADKKMARAMI